MMLVLAFMSLAVSAFGQETLQGRFQPIAYDYSSWGRPGMEANTLQLPDSDEPFGAQTEMWILENSVTCEAGNQSGGSCYRFGNDSAFVSGYGIGYRTWLGMSKHYVIEQFSPYTWHVATDPSPWRTTLYAGEPPLGPVGTSGDEEDCRDDETWDEDLEKCIPIDSPILIPLTQSQAIRLTSPLTGVSFDIDGDGTIERVAWTEAGTRVAFLAIDQNGNGRIDSGKELLGNHTVVGVGDGFGALQALNMQLNGGRREAIIDEVTPLYAKLLLWEDVNHNGFSEAAELQPASNVVSGIGLGIKLHHRRDGHGNFFKFQGFAHIRTEPGRNLPQSPRESKERVIRIYDVFLKVQR